MLKIGDLVRIRSLSEVDRKPEGSWANELFENCICKVMGLDNTSTFLVPKYILQFEKKTPKVCMANWIPNIKRLVWEEYELEKIQ